MKRISFACVVVVLTTIGLLTTASRAQTPPEFLDHYRVLPRLSTLHQTGGIAGFDLRYRLLGKYDFQHGLGWTSTASFDNAEIWGSAISDGPTPAYVIDVDQLLNLEGLKGEALPVGAPFDVYRFRGETANGSAVQLFASVIGPWMYVRGGTLPPPNSADYFQYDVQMVARSRPFADFNDDGVVDAADYTILRNSGDMSGAGSAASDSISAGAGYEEWKAQFGETVPDFAAMDATLSAAAAGFGAASATPEPASLSLVLIGGLLLAGWRRRNAR
jgi:PEP-CTERM motif